MMTTVMSNIPRLVVIHGWTLVILLHLALVSGFLRISEHMRNMNIEQGGRAKFVCKVDVHPLEEMRLSVSWKFKDHLMKKPSVTAGRFSYKREGNRFTLIIRNTKPKDTGVYTCIARVGLNTEMTSAFLQIKNVPDPPIHVKVTSCHGNNAGLSWDPSRDNGDEILAYSVQFNTTDKPSVWHDNDEEFGPHTRMVTLQLYPWGTYSFRIISRNAIGSSKPSAATSRMCTTPPDRPDRNPGNIRTVTNRKKYLIIEWTPMIRLYFHGPRFQYEVRWRMKGTFRWHTETVTDPYAGRLESETNDVYRVYEIQVRAENSMGPAHQPAFVYTGRSGESEPLISPSNFSLNPDYKIDPHTAHFIWETVKSDPQLICGKLKGYKLRYWKASEGWNKTKEVEIIVGDDVIGHGQNIKVALSDLPAYTSLKAQVAVMNSHYTGPYSDELDFFTPEGVPTAVTNLRLKSYGFAYVLIKWSLPSSPNGVIHGYDVAYQQVVGVQLGKVRPLTPPINDPSILGARITGLRSGHHYRFLVWARTKSHRGDPAFIDVMTAKGRPPHAPKMRVSAVDKSSVNITWESDKYGPDMKYSLEYRHAGQSKWHNSQYVNDRSWVTLDDSLPINDLEVRLVASNRLGDTATSKTLAIAKSLKKAAKVRHPSYKTHTSSNLGPGSGVSKPHPPSHASFLLLVLSLLLPVTSQLLPLLRFGDF